MNLLILLQDKQLQSNQEENQKSTEESVEKIEYRITKLKDEVSITSEWHNTVGITITEQISKLKQKINDLIPVVDTLEKCLKLYYNIKEDQKKLHTQLTATKEELSRVRKMNWLSQKKLDNIDSDIRSVEFTSAKTNMSEAAHFVTSTDESGSSNPVQDSYDNLMKASKNSYEYAMGPGPDLQTEISSTVNYIKDLKEICTILVKP